MRTSDNKSSSQTRSSSFNWTINGAQIGAWTTSEVTRSYVRTGQKSVPRSSGKVGPFGLYEVHAIDECRTERQHRTTTCPSTWIDSNGRTQGSNNPAYYVPYASGNQFMQSATTNLAPITSAQITRLCDLVVQDAMGNIKPDASLLVDLAEIGETIAMVTSIKGLLSAGPRILRQRFDTPCLGRNMVAKVRNLLHRTHVYDAVSADLAYKFGVSPLISSITSLMAWEEEVTKRLSTLAHRNANPGLTLIRKTLRQERISQAEEAVGLRTIRNYSRNLAVAGGWCDAHYNINTRSAVELTKQYLGLNQLAQAIWNLIPFSFVADWVVRVGGLAERIDAKLAPYAHGLTVGKATLYHPWYSVKASVQQLDCLKVAKSSSYPACSVYQQISSVSYKRTPGLIDSPGIIAGSGFDAWRLGTAGELVIQLTRR